MAKSRQENNVSLHKELDILQNNDNSNEEGIDDKLLNAIAESTGQKKAPWLIRVFFKKIFKSQFSELQKSVDEIEEIAAEQRKDPLFKAIEDDLLKSLRK